MAMGMGMFHPAARPVITLAHSKRKCNTITQFACGISSIYPQVSTGKQAPRGYRRGETAAKRGQRDYLGEDLHVIYREQKIGETTAIMPAFGHQERGRIRI